MDDKPEKSVIGATGSASLPIETLIWADQRDEAPASEMSQSTKNMEVFNGKILHRQGSGQGSQETSQNYLPVAG